MPTYQYQCRDCGHEFERFQKFSEDPLTVCPACEGVIKRVIQNVGVVFKGSGWYINDSRKPASTPSAEASSTDADKAKPAEAKPDAGAPAPSSADKPAKATEKSKPAAAAAT